MEDKKIELSLSLVNGVLQYLGTRPYQEVYQLIDGMKEAAKPPMTPLQEVPTEEQEAA